MGLSGGVDSAVVASLLARVLPRNQWLGKNYSRMKKLEEFLIPRYLLAVYIDHGMMRAGESDAVKE